MSIKKRLILSNIGMIVIPIISFIIIEMVLAYFIFIVFKGDQQGEELKLFMRYRLVAMIIVIILTNGFLTYYVSKSIIAPISKLTVAARKISEGVLEYSIKSNKKDELGELTNTFEKMRIKLKEAENLQLQYEEKRQELIASISHDLKTPLTSIKGYIKGIQDGVANTPEKLERYINTINKTTNNMDGLIDELLLFSNLDLQQTPLHMENVDLYTFFVDFVEELTFNLEQERGSVTLIANKENAYVVQADREKLRRVVMNIAQNSLKYMDLKTKEIQVKLSTTCNEVIVEIKDNGSGIAQEDIPFVFDRFYRTDHSRNSTTGGSGLGLAIVKKIIHEFGGTVWIESELGEGTSVYFKLKKGDENAKDINY